MATINGTVLTTGRDGTVKQWSTDVGEVVRESDAGGVGWGLEEWRGAVVKCGDGVDLVIGGRKAASIL